MHDRDPAAEPPHLGHLVGDDQEGHAVLPVHAEDRLHDDLADGRMHARERLVHQDHLEGMDHQGAGDLHQHRLPARELLGEGVAVPVHRDEFELAARARLDLRHGARGGAGPLRVAREQDVLEHRHVPEELRDLEGAGHALRRDLVRPQAVHAPAVEMDLARVEAVEAGEDVHGGGLAGAVGADQPADLAAGQRQREPVHRDHAAEPLDDAPGLEHRRHGGGSGRAPAHHAASIDETTPRVRSRRRRRPSRDRPARGCSRRRSCTGV